MALTAGSNEDGCNKVSVDRISHLPPGVAERILECLPLKDAVRISILSNYWRYKWALLPQLILDPDFFSTVLQYRPLCEAPYFDDCCDHDCYLCKYACEISEDMFARSKLVENMLLCHVGPIHKFVLCIPHWFPRNADISRWIQFVSGKFVQEFTVRPEQNTYLGLLQMRKVPSCIFSGVGFAHLTHLTLIKFRLPSLPPTFRGFPRLVSLQVHLFFVTDGEANKIEILVSKCPLLESLDLDLHEGSCLSIHAPKLQNLVLAGWLSGICLKETNKIKTLSLKIPLHQHEKRDTIMGFFTCLPNVEKLVLDYYFWLTDWLNEIGPPQKVKLPGQLRQLRDLKFDRVTFINEATISFICYFVKMAPKLQKFYINVTDAGQPSTNNMIIHEDCCLYYLRSAKFCCHRGTLSPTLQLIKLILASSPILEVMIIEAIEEDKDKLNIVKELLQYYPRASADTEIIFKT